MADTARTKAALAALLANNDSGDISPQDVRDFLETMHPHYSGFYISSAAPTTCTDAATYYKAAGTTADSSTAHRMTVATTNRLTLDAGQPTAHFHIAASVSFTTSGTNDIIAVDIAKNGTPIGQAPIRRRVSVGTDIGSSALHADTSLAAGDYLELWVANETIGGTTVTLDTGYLFALGMMV